MNLLQEILRDDIFSHIQKLWDSSIKKSDILISNTPNPEIGHLASSVAFVLAKELKKTPMIIADELASSIQIPNIKKIESLKRIY